MTVPSFSETSAFIAVLEQRSFRKAAKLLDLSPPRVSEMVRRLEEQLGVRLLERTTRSVAPTTAGEALLMRLKPALEEYRAALDVANEFREKPAGMLRISAAPPAIDGALMATFADFLAAYPEISLELCSDSALTDIVASRFDAGIRPADRLERDMIAVRVSDPIPVVVVAAPSYLKRRSKPRTPADLSAHDCIRIRLQSGATLAWRFRVQRRTVEVSVEGRLILNDSPMAQTAATRGAGLFQLPRTEVARELLDGRLITVLDDYQPPPVEGFFLYYPGRRQPRPALKVLVEFLRDARRRRRR